MSIGKNRNAFKKRVDFGCWVERKRSEKIKSPFAKAMGDKQKGK
jgi:hypothetical protein